MTAAGNFLPLHEVVENAHLVVVGLVVDLRGAQTAVDFLSDIRIGRALRLLFFVVRAFCLVKRATAVILDLACDATRVVRRLLLRWTHPHVARRLSLAEEEEIQLV